MPAKNRGAQVGEFRLAEFLPYRLAVVTEAVSRVFAENFEEAFKLTRPEWRVLAVVVENGTLSPTLVGQHASMDKVKVSRAVQSLVVKGLLRRTQDPSDGRGLLLSVTRKGRTTHEGLVPLCTKTEAMVFKDLNHSDRAVLRRVLGKITTQLETMSRTVSDDGA
jgi:DNA-binding MarR family transcriptional regulator